MTTGTILADGDDGGTPDPIMLSSTSTTTTTTTTPPTTTVARSLIRRAKQPPTIEFLCRAEDRGARDIDFHLVILDLGLPEMDGQRVLREIRRRGERLPVIILTARTGVSDTVTGLEGGADGYVTKPFSFEELRARVRVRLRDSGEAEPTMLRAGDVVLDLRARRATVGHESVELTAREFTLAETLMRHPGQVLSREQLLSHVWGYGFDPGSNIVDVYVGYLRKKLGDNVIETVRGMGYRLRS